MIKVEKLTFSYTGIKSSQPVFNNLSFSFKSGFNTILGPNGAGKSTLLMSLFGLLNYEGEIFYGKRNLSEMGSEERIRQMSYLPQMDIDTSMLSVLEMVLLGRLPELKRKISDRDLDIVMRIMRQLNIDSLAQRTFSELSGGQQKLVFIAQTLVREPGLILLDEPINSLDLQKQLELCHLLKQIVRNDSVDIITVLHDINLASRYSDHIVIIDRNGEYYNSGTPGETITETMLRDVYGVIASVNYDEHQIPIVSPLRSVRIDEEEVRKKEMARVPVLFSGRSI